MTTDTSGRYDTPPSRFGRRRLLAGIAASAGLGFAGLAGLGAAGCTRVDPNAETNVLEEIRRTGTARLAIGNEPPYTKLEISGEVTGVEPDVARAVLRELGVDNVVGIVTPYDAMIPGLQARRWDMVTAGLFMNTERCSQILYSDPVIVSTESFGVPPGNPSGLTSVAAVKENPDVRLGVLTGAYEEGVTKRSGIPDRQLVNITDNASGLDALSADRIDAFFLPTLSLQALPGAGKRFEVTPPLADVSGPGSGTGFRQRDDSFRDAYNRAYAAVRESGHFAKILDHWGFDAELAMQATTKELCQAPAA